MIAPGLTYRSSMRVTAVVTAGVAPPGQSKSRLAARPLDDRAAELAADDAAGEFAADDAAGDVGPDDGARDAAVTEADDTPAEATPDGATAALDTAPPHAVTMSAVI